MVDWTDYSQAYDLLLEHNPAYQEIISDFVLFLKSNREPKKVLDIGAGTGNYSLAVLNAYPNSIVDLVEPDAGMASIARIKLKKFPNVKVIEQPISNFKWQDYDLVISVHSLYAIPNYTETLKNIRISIKKSDGIGYLCNVGRILDIPDWRKYLVKINIKKHGFFKTIDLLWRGRVIARENIKIAEKQKSGEYWTHTSEEFLLALNKNKLDIIDAAVLYRGYSDRAIVKSG